MTEKHIWWVLGIGAGSQVCAGWQGIVTELPGHGQSEPGSLRDAALRLEASLLEDDDVTLVGWSLGAVVVGLALDSRELLAHLSRVVLLAPSLTVGDALAQRNSTPEFAKALRGLMSTQVDHRAQGAGAYARLVQSPGYDRVLGATLEDTSLSVDPGVYRELLSEPLDVRTAIGRASLDVEVVIVHGREDAVLAVEGSRDFVAAEPAVSLREVSGGHAWFLLNPDSVRDFS